MLYTNIFLEIYQNPQTAEQLSLELGIALPYMEDELAFLCREELLKKMVISMKPILKSLVKKNNMIIM